MRLLRTAVLAVMVSMAVALAACGGDEGATSGGSGDGGGSGASKSDLKSYAPGTETVRKVDDTTFPIEKASKRYVIGMTLPHFKDPFWIAMAYGAEQEAKRLGVEIRINAASGYGDTAGQLQQIDTYMAQGVDGMVVGAVDSKGIAPAVDRAWGTGVPVSYVNALAESKTTMGVYTDDQLAGEKQALFIAEHDPKAKVIAMCGPPGVVWPKLRCESFVKTLEENAPDVEVLTSKYHDMDRAKIADVGGNTLQAFPKTSWIFNNTDLQAKGVVDALRAEGRKPGDIRITNLTIGDELFGIMKQGWITYALAERPVLQGRLALDQVVMVLDGEQPPANWAVDLPGFEGTAADQQRFEETEAKWNYSPKGYRP